MRFVIDNSVVMAWCFEDEDSGYAERVLERLADARAVVPSIWPLEVVNVLLTAERRKRLRRSDVAHFLNLVASLPIAVEPDAPGRVFTEVLSLAREAGLTSYDASYLDLAMREGIPLATQDAALRKAAKKLHVKLLGE